MLGQPAKYPSHLTEALAKRFRFPDSDEPPHTLIGIDADGDWPPTIDATMKTIASVAPPSEIVDVVRIDDSGTWSYLVNETKPFYTRKKGKLFGLF